MKRLLLNLSLGLVVGCSGFATADEGAEEKENAVVTKSQIIVQKVETKSDKKSDPKLETKVMGQAVIIGPDGTKKEFKFGDPKGKHEFLEKLPEEVRQRVEEAMKLSSKKVMLGQGLVIDADGDKKVFKLGHDAHFSEAFKHLPEDARKQVEKAMRAAGEISVKATGGRMIVIGPDGEKQEFKIGEVDINEEALEGLPKMLRKRVLQKRKNVTSENADIDTSSSEKLDASLSEKLDAILSRLDKIEQEIESLKESK